MDMVLDFGISTNLFSPLSPYPTPISKYETDLKTGEFGPWKIAEDGNIFHISRLFKC